MTDTAESIRHDTARVRHLLGITGDPAGLRILDLAARTGWFCSALAERGAVVHAIEGREVNAAHIRPQPNLTVEIADVRTLSRDRHGTFDVSLCLGILYHLDAESALGLLGALAEVTTGYAVIDTNTCAGRWEYGKTTITAGGEDWQGCYYPEGMHPWDAIGNASSFWFTREDLTRAILRAGFASVEQVPGKGHPEEPDERLWFRAVAR